MKRFLIKYKMPDMCTLKDRTFILTFRVEYFFGLFTKIRTEIKVIQKHDSVTSHTKHWDWLIKSKESFH